MKLRKSRSAAEEELTLLINSGYRILHFLTNDYNAKQASHTFDPQIDNETYGNQMPCRKLWCAETAHHNFRHGIQTFT